MNINVQNVINESDARHPTSRKKLQHRLLEKSTSCLVYNTATHTWSICNQFLLIAHAMAHKYLINTINAFI